ncbi:peroxidase [Agrobacterium sp. B131/95]|nr:peroxidase [Agrobacterium sp. B131/95]
MEEPISRLRVPTEDELPQKLRDIHMRIRKKFGFVPNFLTALSANPGTALRIMAFYEHLFDQSNSHLSASERELIAVVTSVATGCSYCVFNHRPALAAALGDRVLADRIARNHNDVTLAPRERALADLAQKLAATPHSVGSDDFAWLRAIGFSEPAILEVLEVSAFFSYGNRLTIALNVLPDPQFFVSA